MRINRFLFFMILLGSQAVFSQKYLNTEMPEIEMEWKDHSFFSEKTLMENISEIAEFSVFSKIIRDNNLEELLEKTSMFTIFVFEDTAFSSLSEKEQKELLQNRNLMRKTIPHLMVPGRIDLHGLKKEAEKHGGSFSLLTLNKENLKVEVQNEEIYLTDSEGRKAPIHSGDFYHKKGIFHIIDTLVFP